MAQGHYHFTTKLISRSDGRSICAAAAYRSGEKIRDEHYGKTFDYTPRTSIYGAEIRAPDHAPDWMKDRSQLWNRVEAFETRKNSRLAREFEVSIPEELSPAQRQEAIRQFVDTELVARGMVADVAYHDFTGQHRHNPHAHILVTTREIDGNNFSKKKTREWDKEETLLHWREAWAKHANRALEQAQSHTRIDHRSNKDRGITAPPLNESRGQWYIRQKDITATQKQLDAVGKELAELHKEQEHERQERLDGIIQIGSDLARTHALQEQQAQLAKAAVDAFQLGQRLAQEGQEARRREQDAQQRQQEKKRPDRQPGRGLEPWKRDWEKEHEAQHKRREERAQQRERKARIQQNREAMQQQQPSPAPVAPTHDDRALIEQWKQFHDRERDKSRATGRDDQAATPARDTSLDQQTAKLKEDMAAFESEAKDWKYAKRQKSEPPPQPEQKHERGPEMGR